MRSLYNRTLDALVITAGVMFVIALFVICWPCTLLLIAVFLIALGVITLRDMWRRSA